MLNNILLKVSEGVDQIPILGSKLWDYNDFGEMLIRFFIDFVVAFVIIRLIYYPIHKRKDYLFTYFMFNILIFFICILLNSVKLKLGFAFGLFAIFGILRYRTEQLPIKEMTYLFMIIAIAIINSLTNNKISIAEVVFTNIAIMTGAFLLERVFLLKHESRKEVVYEKIENVKPENHNQLISDLKERTGLEINRIQVGKIDFLRDTVRIMIHYYEDDPTKSYNEGKTYVSNRNE